MSQRKKTEKNENSVQVALNDLMGIEDERQRELEKERQRLEAEEKEREAKAAREAILAEEARIKALEEEQRLREAEEERKREEKERQAKAKECRIRAQVKAEALALEHQRLLEFELEAKRIAVSTKRSPGWLWPFVAVVILGVVSTCAMIVANISGTADMRVAASKDEVAQIQRHTQAKLAAVHDKNRILKDRADRLNQKNIQLNKDLERAQADQCAKNSSKGAVNSRGRSTPSAKNDKSRKNNSLPIERLHEGGVNNDKNGPRDDPDNGHIDWGETEYRPKRRP